jgi:hypothetical protein
VNEYPNKFVGAEMFQTSILIYSHIKKELNKYREGQAARIEPDHQSWDSSAQLGSALRIPVKGAIRPNLYQAKFQWQKNKNHLISLGNV